MSQPFLLLFICFITFDFFLERILAFLNLKALNGTLPKGLSGIYDAEKYQQSQEYERSKQKFSMVTGILTFFGMMVFLLLGGFAWIDHLVRQFTNQPLLITLLYFGIIGIASMILTLPFEIYEIFVLEEKFGFNKTTIGVFISDKLKGLLLGTVIGGGLLALITLIYLSTGSYFWILTWLIISIFSVFMMMFYSNLIVPLFNKQTPLEPGTLRDEIEKFAQKVGFRLKNIYVMDGSKRSSKSNAYFTGLGMKKRIVLYDTLIRDHPSEELVAVLAHEIGHYKLKHTMLGMVMGILQMGLMLFILSFFIHPDDPVSSLLCQALSGFSGQEVKQGFHLGLMGFGILYSPISLVLGLGFNTISRRNEFAADHYAGMNYSASALSNALVNLSKNNLSNLQPHPAYVFFYYSHPTLLQRITALGKK